MWTWPGEGFLPNIHIIIQLTLFRDMLHRVHKRARGPKMSKNIFTWFMVGSKTYVDKMYHSVTFFTTVWWGMGGQYASQHDVSFLMFTIDMPIFNKKSYGHMLILFLQVCQCIRRIFYWKCALKYPGLFLITWNYSMREQKRPLIQKFKKSTFFYPIFIKLIHNDRLMTFWLRAIKIRY